MPSRIPLSLLVFLAAGAIHAVGRADDFEGCVPAAEGTVLDLPRAASDKPLRAVVMGRGARAVVF